MSVLQDLLDPFKIWMYKQPGDGVADTLVEKCSACRFYGEGDFVCLRHAPVVAKVPDAWGQLKDDRRVFPATFPSSWCGDFERRKM